MPDGRRKRRFSPDRGKRLWYSYLRGVRFATKMGGKCKYPLLEGFLIYVGCPHPEKGYAPKEV